MAKVALITGANQGIGYGIVRRLCKEHPNWIIYGTSRSVPNGEEATNKLKEEGHTATFLQADLTDSKSFEAVKDRLVKDHGGLDILINNAGMVFKSASTEAALVKSEVTFATNVFGTNMVCDTLFPILKDGARVVILSSGLSPSALRKVKALNMSRYESFIANKPCMTREQVLASSKDYIRSVKEGKIAEEGWPDDAAYSLSKLFDTLLARAMQQEFDNNCLQRDIVVNAVEPGYVNTSLTSNKGSATIDEGADSSYYCAVLPPNTTVRGAEVDKDRKIRLWQ